jgi:hypothetical protein
MTPPYNSTTGIDKQFLLILAAIKPEDTDSDFWEKADLVASFLDLTYIRKLVNGPISTPADLDN